MRLRAVQLLVLGALVALITAVTSVALASWGTSGNGSGTGTVASLDPPTSVTVSTASPNTVTVAWTASTPPVGTLEGYYVTRHQGPSSSNACGTVPGSPASYIPDGSTTCIDSLVPNGNYTYTVTAVFRTWTATSAPSGSVTVTGDATAPTQVLTLASGASNAHLAGNTLYFRSGVPGSFAIESSVGDAGAGPASATFPDVTGTGWTHTAETITSGVGTNPITYTSSPFTWTAGASTPTIATVTARDAVNNSVDNTVTFIDDSTTPTGGALTVNGVVATAGGSTSSARTAFTIGVRTDYVADTGSGLATSVLTRESAPYANGACGTFGTPVTLAGAPNQTGLATSCYRYTLTGTDRVGNVSSLSTVVRYDSTVPTRAISLTSGDSASLTGTRVYFRNTVAGSFVLNATVTDGASGPASATFPLLATAGWTHPAQTVTTGSGAAPVITYSSSTYSWLVGSAAPGTHTVTSRDVAGNAGTNGVTFSVDNTAPVSGALTVNGTAANAAGTSSFNRTGAFTIGTRTNYTDAGSGISTSVLTVQLASLSTNTCGAFGAATVIAGNPAQSSLGTGCHRYTLTGTDRVGNVASISTIVKVDRDLPTSGALTVNGTAASAGGTQSDSAAPTFPLDARVEWIDGESGLATSTLTRQAAPFTAGSCGTYGATTTISGTPVQSGLATSCYRYRLTGVDNAGNSVNVSTVVRRDVTNPVSGALTVNGVAATAAGSTSNSFAPSFTIGTRTDYTDGASGIASSTLTREFAPSAGTTCGAFGAATIITGNSTQSGLATGCYRYRLTGVDQQGNTATLSTVVQVRVYVTGLSLINGSGIAGRVDAGDSIEITFSDDLAVSSMCSAWSGDGSDQSLNADNQVTVRLNNAGGSDTITASSTACTLRAGTVRLGSTAYATASVNFVGAGVNKSTAVWNAAARSLTLTLGTASGPGAATVATSTPQITPSTAVTNVDAVPSGGVFTGSLGPQM
jgi:hypothetical protein